MGKVRVRKETGKLFLDFSYMNMRCREQTTLADTSANQKKLNTLLNRIEAEITLGVFDYAKTFPNSSNLKKINSVHHSLSKYQKSPKFKDFAELWFEEMKVTWRFSYQNTIRGIFDKRLIDYFGEHHVDEIDKAMLLRFRVELASPDGNGKGLSATHINRHIKIMKMILREAADRYSFPKKYSGIKPLKEQRTDVDPLSLDEINLILANIRKDYKDYYMVRFFTGMRTGEIHGLKWKNIDFKHRQILIRETFVQGRTEYTKTDSSQREIEMSELVYEALINQQNITGDKEYVFCNHEGMPLDNNNVGKRVWHPILRKLDIRSRSPYQARHTAATLWLASGENPEWIARQMGHSNTEMLFRVYSRYVPNLTRKDGSAFERLLKNNINLEQGEE